MEAALEQRLDGDAIAFACRTTSSIVGSSLSNEERADCPAWSVGFDSSGGELI